MRRLAQHLWNLLHDRSSRRRSPKRPARRARAPRLEVLEDRLVLSSNSSLPAVVGDTATAGGIAATAVLSGHAYLDANGDGVREAGEGALPGVQITLTGTDDLGDSIFQTATTDANGAYVFFDMRPGTYSLARGAATGFLDGLAAPGNLGGTALGTSTVTINVAQDQAGINYDFGVLGVAPPFISLRDFLSSSTLASLPFLPAGTGAAAADGSSLPSGPASGTSSLAGFVYSDANANGLRDAGELGVAGVIVALTGLTDSGIPVSETTTTDANGAYQFGGLAAGGYTINVAQQPTGFQTGVPAIGSLGGGVLRPDQITSIPLADGVAGTDYDFGELPPGAPPIHVVEPGITAALASPTVNGLTADPAVKGTVINVAAASSLRAGFDSTPAANFVEVRGDIQPDGSFLLDQNALDQIAGGSLSVGPHTLHLQVRDAQGNISGTADVSFTFDHAPVVSSPIANFAVAQNTSSSTLDLAGNFTDPDITDSLVQFNTNAGPIDVQLFDTTAPRTVANFLDYVNSGAYNNSIFHRSMPNFVLQGGGFTFQSNPSNITAIPTLPSVQNEFGASNVRGTLAMAQQGNASGTGTDPNSATDEFFFNLVDNSSSLDPQKFAVFGQVVSPSDQSVVDALAAIPTKSETSFNPAFTNLPLQNYNGTNFPTDTTAANYALINNIAILKQTDALTYQVVGNTNPGLVTPVINANDGNRLILQYAANQTGSATITVQATDKFGATVTTSFTVTVS